MGHRHFPDNFKDFASLTLFDGIPQFSGKPISHGKQIHLGTGQKLYHILAGTCINPSHFEFINFSQDPSRSWGPTPGSTHRIRPPCQKSAGWMMGQRGQQDMVKKAGSSARENRGFTGQKLGEPGVECAFQPAIEGMTCWNMGKMVSEQQEMGTLTCSMKRWGSMAANTNGNLAGKKWDDVFSNTAGRTSTNRTGYLPGIWHGLLKNQRAYCPFLQKAFHWMILCLSSGNLSFRISYQLDTANWLVVQSFQT